MFPSKGIIIIKHLLLLLLLGRGLQSSGPSSVFPRINVRDPYKRLGISREASEEEIQAARNFLINLYSGHKPSVDAIESAYDKILVDSFRARRRPKIDVQGKWKKIRQSRVVKFISSRFEAPSTNIILTTAALFLVLGTWSILYPFPVEDGPVLQVTISLIAAIYFIYSRLKNRLRAFLYGLAAFIVSWVLGSLLMATVLPPIATGPRSIEVSTSVISYIFLWIASAYLK
uniref:J domain-containing protein n=1 Tax=Araucaria cunninghamii TaxID=56994 RepID=A0A0D6R2T0_ARACU